MKSLNEIITEIDERKLPASKEDVAEWIKSMESLGVSASSRISMLVGHARRTFFSDGEAGFHKWARESFNFKANHTSHCAKIGALLLDAETASFQELAKLPFNKLIALARLTPSQIESLRAEGKAFDVMTRDELRDAVRQALGEEASAPKRRDPSAERVAEIVKLSKLSLEELDSLAKSADAESAQAMLTAGRNLLAIGLEAAQSLKLDGALDKAARLLSIQLNEIRRLQGELKASQPAPMLETKTA